MKRTLAALLIGWAVNTAAQDVTGNIIYSTTNPPPPGSVYSWSGFILTESGGGGESGGNVPAYNPSVGQFMWGYAQGTVDYSVAVGSVLSGSGIVVTGMEYGLQYWNQDFSRGTLSTTITLRDSSGKILQSYYHALPQTTEGWTNFDMTKTFSSPYSLASLGTLSLSATGKDDRFWAGYYGPQIRDPYARLNYGPDPCETNPLSSPTCAGFAAAMASLTTVPAPVAAAPIESTTAVSEPVVTTAAPTASVAVTTASPPPSSAAVSERTPALISPRLLSIVRSVNELTAATVTATVTQSIEQSQSAAAAQDLALAATSTSAGNRAGAATANTESDAGAGSLTRPGDPVAAARSGRTQTAQEDAREEPKSNRSAPPPPAELAGGISVAALTQGADLTSYAALALRDAQFYAPREIYRGQRVIDNARVLRGLGSDARHAEMVDQQYRR